MSLAISGMLYSNSPSVLGLVIIMAAIVSPSVSRSWRKSSTSTVPSALLFTSTTSKPHTAADAGLVPCAESGTITFVRFSSLRLSCQPFIIINPVSSPCAPAKGFRVKASKPVSSHRDFSNAFSNSNAPLTVDSGWRGCRLVNAGSAAISSLMIGLYFIVQLPSG